MPVFLNNIEISDDEVHNEMQYHPAPTVEEARREAARALVIKRLLLNAAVEQELISEKDIEGIDKAKEEMIIETLLDNIIQLPEADEVTCQRYYDKNLNRFEDQKTGNVVPFPMVEKHIRTYLEDRGHQAAFSAYMDSLMDQATIVGI